MEAAARKKDQRMHHPYDPEKNKGKGPGRPREFNRPPRCEFLMGLADLIAFRILPPGLKRLRRRRIRCWGQNRMCGVSSIRVLTIPLIRVWLWGHQLAELVKCGFLKDYLLEKQTGQSSDSQPVSDEGQQHEVPLHGEIHTIAGGFSDGGCTASQRKKYARLVMLVEVFEDHSPDVDITFTKEDLKDVVPHDNDPIMIPL